MAVINVTSEIMPLKRVLLHRPGKELLNLTPSRLGELLFDDIPFLETAQQEHDVFAKILKDNGVEVVYLEDLITETLDQNKGLREQFTKQFIVEGGMNTKKYQKILLDFFNKITDTKQFILKTMEGINLNELTLDKSNSLDDLVSDPSTLVLDPMPNLYFTRDPFASVGDGVVLNRMYSVTRNRETIYADYIFKHHKDYKGQVEFLYDRNNAFHIEGGDILNINEKVLAIGISQRTEPDAIDQLAKNIFYHSKCKVEKILAFDIPSTRAFMHLDTVFTQIDTDKFTVHPGILGTLQVFEITKTNNEEEVKVKLIEDTLEHILKKYVGHDVELILCGGGDQIAADREQWNDGSNTLCIKPGTIVVYERNTVTNAVLREKGLNVIEMPSAELSRGRGGPRCMSMPLYREN
ncbi:arginine deiminase [Treponema phagedenis]|uniref:Arginine deiminase n=2 Tax=Treponema phagedenis TaxID=162 RepID=A0AAE6IX00_TREPH|nr:arginine deiminase [Treponema phagedenis]NVP24253.1 arginine deiminase [Treponema phagedenis]QEJ96400.1 arginine deiminase [Treponema phagedenis]QEJ99697.1 arginine deiminase [Treponema phagedenis]QEK02192.1 arginine deiminase [Treponema phagedenis]QEK05246.1 arginine deiminase [Treponema phagedenis]